MHNQTLPDETTQNTDRLLTLEEVQTLVPVSGHALRRYELKGLLRTFRPGGRRRMWRASDVRDFIAGQTLPKGFTFTAVDPSPAHAALRAKYARAKSKSKSNGRGRGKSAVVVR